LSPLHVGIVGCSAEGAALCYRTICAEGAARLGPHAHPEVSLHTPSLADLTLVPGIVRPASTAQLAAVIDRLRQRGCDAVALACTELPLVLDDANSPLPTLDSTRLLALAALDRALAPR
jgi:aspartate racemase